MITKEAIEAGIAAANERYLDFMIEDETAFDQAVEAGILAALSTLPIAVEGKVAWESPEEREIEQRAFQAVSGRSDVPADVQQLVVKLWAMYCDAASPSCPGKDGGQEVEADRKIAGMIRQLHALRTAFDMKGANATTILRVINTLSTMERVAPQPASVALVERLMKALEPFCKHYEPWMERWDNQQASSTFSRHTFGDLREALAAVNEARSALSTSNREGDDAQD